MANCQVELFTTFNQGYTGALPDRPCYRFFVKCHFRPHSVVKLVGYD